MSVTFSEFRSAVMEKAFPDGEPENLVKQHRSDLISALLHIQSHCDFYKRNVSNVYAFCSTYFWCGASVLEAPRGVIKRVYTLPATLDCCPVDYEFVQNFDTFRAWMFATRPRWETPENLNLPEIQSLGMRYAESSTDKGHRFEYGYYCVKEGRIYLAHRIESTERVVVEYDGIKRNWKDEDLIPVNGWYGGDNDDGIELISLCAKYVAAQDRLLYTEDTKGGAAMMAQFNADFAELIWRIKREAKPEDKGSYKPRPILSINAPCKSQECEEAEAAAETPMVFAILGDTQNYTGTENAENVATLIDSWGPEFIVTVGDNWYGSATTLADLDENIGTLYRKFIYPYRGTQGEEVSTRQNFYAAVGNHDIDPVPRLDIVREYFNLPPTGADKTEPCRGYYDFVRGDVHFFILHSGFNNSLSNQQADGNQIDSAQAEWFYEKARTSTAKWKIAICHHAPYGSGTNWNAAQAVMRWQFKDYVDAVVSGHSHNYERLEVDGLPYIVNGLGGAAKIGFGTPSEYSLVRYSDKYGAIKASVTCDSLALEFFNTDGDVVDTLELTK